MPVTSLRSPADGSPERVGSTLFTDGTRAETADPDLAGQAMSFRKIAGHFGSLTWVAVRSLTVTAVVVLAAGALLAWLSWVVVRDCPWWYGLIAVVLAAVEAVAAAVVLGIGRGVVNAAVETLRRLQLGRLIVGQVFQRILGVREGEEVGERGGAVARGLERLPLAQANTRLDAAVAAVTGEVSEGGWLRRAVRRLLLKGVRAVTLARFRDDTARHGGVDLLKVRDGLGGSVDGRVADHLRGQRRGWTLSVAVGLVLLAFVQTAILRTLKPADPPPPPATAPSE